MIIPFLDGLLTFSKAPVTWILIFFNVFLFSQNYQLSKDCQQEFKAWYQDSDFLYTQGQVYRQFSQKRDVARVIDMEMLGRLAFRDENFLQKAPDLPWIGDPVALARWKTDLLEFRSIRAFYPPLLLGVSDYQKDFFSTLSYQFYHEGFAHLLGNILLILIVGGFIERRYSGLMVMGLYLFGGSLAALIFIQLGYSSGAPLVGASGSLCALLGFLFLTERENKTRLFYMILPSKKYMGFVFVPTIYWILLLCMAEDVSGWLSQPALFSSGVAHGVHILGFSVGLVVAFFCKELLKIKPRLVYE